MEMIFLKNLITCKRSFNFLLIFPTWKVDDISRSVEEIIDKELKDSDVQNEFKNNEKLIIKAVESNPRQLKRFINNVILAKAVFNNLRIEFDGLIVVRALDFRREWNRFLELIIPDETRRKFCSEYKKLKTKGVSISNEQQDKIAEGTSDSLVQDKDILEIYKEVEKNKPLVDFLDSGALEVLGKIEKMEDYRRAVNTTKLNPTEEKEAQLIKLLREGKIEEFNNTRPRNAGINLEGIYLMNAKLFDVDLRYDNLTSAHLSGANLSYAFLYMTNLSDADLRGANLHICCYNLSHC
jgi:hypothetical protein